MLNRALLIIIIIAGIAGVGVLMYFSATANKHIDSITSFNDCVADGNEVTTSHPRQCRVAGKVFVEGSEDSTEIKLETPVSDEAITLPLLISGKASKLTDELVLRLRDADNNVVIQKTVPLGRVGLDEFAPFEMYTAYPEVTTASGTVELFYDSSLGDDELAMVRIPVVIPEFETESVRIYLGSKAEDPDVLNCDVSYPVERRVPAGEDTIRWTLTELISGPTHEEVREGYYTNIKPRTTLLGFDLNEGVATANFSEEIQSGIGGSCTVSAIRSQIVRTLLQFADVEEVIIAVEGKSEGVLQP